MQQLSLRSLATADRFATALAQPEAFYIEILHEQESMEPESEMRKLCDALLVYIKQQQQLQSIEILTAKMEKVFEE